MIASARSINNNLTVRELRRGDLGQVSTIHLAAFPHSALTMLGAETVRRYYQWQLDGEPEAVGFGAFEGDELLGYCFGGIFRGATSGFLRQNSLFLAVRLLTHPWYLANSLFRTRLVLGLRLLKRLLLPDATKAAHDPSTIIPFHVLAIAVHPKNQGRGVGKVLMERIEEIARDRGQREIALTVHADNFSEIRFYESLGWEKWLVDGKWNGLMKKVNV